MRTGPLEILLVVAALLLAATPSLSASEPDNARFFRFPDIHGDTRIVFENGGLLYLLDTATGEHRKVDVFVPDDQRQARKHWVRIDLRGLEKQKDVELLQNVEDTDVTPDGSRLLYRSGKELFIVEPKEGVKAGDAQLERGIAEVLKRIAANPPSWPPRPVSRDLTSPAPRK